MLNSNIYAGSVLKVNGSIATTHLPLVQALRPRAVQVIEYVEGSSGAGKFGFEEETGFTIEDTEEIEDTTPEAVVEEKPAKPAQQRSRHPNHNLLSQLPLRK